MDTTSPIPAQTAVTDHPEERLWKADDLARYIGCSVREIRNMRWAGLPAIKFLLILQTD